MKINVGLCSNCGLTPARYTGRCSACYEYRRLHCGKERPRHLYHRPEHCKNCKAPRAFSGRLKRGRCDTCYTYLRDYGRERPEYAIKRLAPHGWCECGRPAAGEYGLAVLTIDRGKRVEYAERLCVVCARAEGLAA